MCGNFVALPLSCMFFIRYTGTGVHFIYASKFVSLFQYYSLKKPDVNTKWWCPSNDGNDVDDDDDDDDDDSDGDSDGDNDAAGNGNGDNDK